MGDQVLGVQVAAADEPHHGQPMADALIEAAQFGLVRGVTMLDELGPAIAAALENARHADAMGRGVFREKLVDEGAEGGVDRERARLVDHPATGTAHQGDGLALLVRVAGSEADGLQAARGGAGEPRERLAVDGEALREAQAVGATVRHDARDPAAHLGIFGCDRLPELRTRRQGDERVPALLGGLAGELSAHARGVELQQQQARELGMQGGDEARARLAQHERLFAVFQAGDRGKLGSQPVELGREQAAQ